MGHRRYGGAFTLGPVRWEQCKNTAKVILKVKQEGRIDILPACQECWEECIENKIEIMEVLPVK